MRNSRKLVCSWLYADGTLIQEMEETRKGLTVGKTIEVTRGFCQVFIYAKYDDSRAFLKQENVGRIVCHNRYLDREGFLALAKGGKITAIAPDTAGGSDNTKKRNLAVQYVTLETKQGLMLQWADCTDILCSQWTVQPERSWQSVDDDAKVGDKWGDTYIVKITDLRLKEVPAHA